MCTECTQRTPSPPQKIVQQFQKNRLGASRTHQPAYNQTRRNLAALPGIGNSKRNVTMGPGFPRTLSLAPVAGAAFIDPAAAQVIIPYGDFGDGFEKYLVVVITFTLLCLAIWRFYRNRS